MRATVTCLLAFFAMVACPLFSQPVQDFVVKLTATVDAATPKVTLDFENPAPSEVFIFRREKGSTDWFILAQANATSATIFEDDLVNVSQTYEYGVQRTINGITAYGYVTVPVEAPVVDQRGTISLFVEAALETPLSTELERLRLDLIGDGWQVLWHSVPTSATVVSIKSQIVDDYDNSGINSVFLFGELPVPYSGNVAWDGHPEHQGAWPADTYYGDIESSFWTDNTVNSATNATPPSRSENENVPGDGKFDNNIIPSTSELMVGRVDFSNLSEATFGTTRTELYRRYLDKNHNWRTKQYTVDNKALVDDNFGNYNGNVFAQNGYITGNVLVGVNNVIDGNFFEDTNDQSFLFAHGNGPGTYTSASGVGTSEQFASDTVNVVFTQLFGSYHGDWDYSPNPFMMSALASKGGVLNCTWSGFQHWFSHHLGAGETIGYCTRETQNACDNAGYFQSTGACGILENLLGDPSIRAQIVAPVSNVVAAPNCTEIAISWAASTQADVMGYYVYRSDDINGFFDRLTSDPLTDLSFIDGSPLTGSNYYLVKALVREETPSGIFFNTSTGVAVSLNFSTGTQPSINIPITTALTCANPAYILNPCGPGVNCTVVGPGGVTNSTPYTITQAGSYTITAVDLSSGCTATKTLIVTVNNTVPAGPTANLGVVNCPAHTAQLLGNSNPTGISYLWTGPNGFSSTQQNTTATAEGVYTLTATINSSGCTASASVTVPPFTAPDASATGGTINCASPSVQLMGTSNTPSVSYSWTGPNGFTSDEQNPVVTSIGNYLLTVTSANGCVGMATATVSQNGDLPEANPTASGMVGCAITQVTLMANPDMSGYSFAWTGPNGFTSTEENPVVMSAGNYSVLVTNTGTGCASTATVVVGQMSDGPQANPMAQGSLSCVVTQVTLNANPELAGNSFAWTGPNGFTSTDENPVVTEPGTYSVLVTNLATGCAATYSTVVNELTIPPTIILNLPDLEITCATTSVSVNLSAICNLPGLACTLNGQPIAGSVAISQPGNYTVVVTHVQSGCTVSDEFNVTQSADVPNLTVTGVLGLLCADDVTTLTANSTTPGATISWVGLGNAATQIVPSGTYTVIATSTNGCSATQVVMVTAPPALNISVIAGTLDCDGFFDPSVTVTGGVEPYSVSFFPNPPFPPNTMYEIGVTDANGCQAGTTGNTGAAPAPIVGTTTHTNETVLGENDGAATAQATGGVAPYSYLWSNGQTSQTINNLAPGTYTCTITDVNGCTATVTVTILEGVDATTDLPGLRRLVLSPNPTSGRFELAIELENTLPVQVEILDVTGRILTNTALENVQVKTWQFDLSASPAGVYFCKIMAEGKVAVLKVVRME